MWNLFGMCDSCTCKEDEEEEEEGEEEEREEEGEELSDNRHEDMKKSMLQP